MITPRSKEEIRRGKKAFVFQVAEILLYYSCHQSTLRLNCRMKAIILTSGLGSTIRDELLPQI
jgi:hypothetical protein